MKKVFISLLGLAFSLISFGQQVNKNYVLVEIFTSTGCYFCPGAEMGAEDLVNNGKDVAVIAYHHNSFGDTLYNTAGLSRINFYGYQGTPVTYFNGSDNVVGGSHSNSLYSTFLPKYNSAISVMSSFTCNLNLTSTNDLDFTATVDIEKVSGYTGTNLKLFTAVVENDIPYNWEGQSHLNFLERGMYPNGSGIALDFSSTSSVSETINFTVDPSWNLSNCEFIVFVQDMDTKEVLQVEKSPMDLPAGTNNVILQSMEDPADQEVICEDAVYPTIKFKNKGTANLTSVDFITEINGVVTDSTHWTGNMSFGESNEITLGLSAYDQLSSNNIVITAKNPNGVADDYPENNSVSATILQSDQTSNRIFMEMNTGNWGFEISYELYNSDGNVIASGSGFSSNTVVLDTFIVDLDNCYSFELYDSYGNGFNSADGYLKLIDDKNGPVILNVTGDFGSNYHYPFKAVTPAGISSVDKEDINIYPNPVNNILNIKFSKTGSYKISIFDILGKKLYGLKINNSSDNTVDLSNLESGVYFVTITGDLNYSKKIIKK